MNSINVEDYTANSELVIAKKGQKYYAQKSYFTGIAKLARALYLDTDGVPCFYLMQLGGGYVENEKFRTFIHMKEDTRAIVTTQAATKIYKCMNNLPSYQKNEFILEENASLKYISDSVILYKDAMFRQESEVRMRDTSSLIYTDGITSGWSPDGEKFKYSSVQMKLKIYVNDKPVMLDNLKLDPRVDNMSSLGFMEEYNNYSSLVVIDKAVDMKLIEILREEVEKLNLDIKVGITKLECNGFVLRALGNLTQDLEKAIFTCINYIRKEKFDANELQLGKR
ncbi:MAG: urease accessory protein UreD [Sarcina sp.]